MLKLEVCFSDEAAYNIIQSHINRIISDLVLYHRNLGDSTELFPEYLSVKEANQRLDELYDIIECEEEIDINIDMQFSIAMMLVKEATEERIPISAKIKKPLRQKLKKYIPEEQIRYYERYENFANALFIDEGEIDLLEIKKRN